MAQPILLPPAFDGMAQDFPRNNLPKGKAWNIIDYIPQMLGAPGTERGGWAYGSPALGSVDTGATYVKAVVYAPFTGGAKLVTINDTGNLCTVASVSSATKIGAVVIPKQQPVFMHDVLVIPSPDGSTAPKKFNGSAVSALGATAPAAQYAAGFVNRVWMGNTAAGPNFIYPSDAGDATTYDTTNSFIESSGPIFGMAALPNVLMVFMEDHAMRVRGTTPPPDADLIIDDPIFHVGCTDARSIAVNGSQCCFANGTGVYMTNGTANPVDLTEAVGLKKYWRDLLASYNYSTWSLAGDWFGNIYILTVMNGSSFVDCIAFDARRSLAYRLSNVDAVMFASVVQAGQELYAASRGEARLYKLSTMFTPGATFKSDGDGTAVTGVWETPFFETKTFGSQRWVDAYLEYDVRDAATDNPTLTLSYTLSPEAGAAYTALTPTLPETTKKTTARVPVRQANVGIGFKVTRQNASSMAAIYGLAANVKQREGSRLR